jgi:hypothetical protein
LVDEGDEPLVEKDGATVPTDDLVVAKEGATDGVEVAL